MSLSRGIRSARYAMVVEDKVVKHLAVEEAGKFEVSSAEVILAALIEKGFLVWAGDSVSTLKNHRWWASASAEVDFTIV